MIALAAFLLLTQNDPASDLELRMRAAVLSGDGAQVQTLFKSPQDAAYLFRMAPRVGGFKNLQVDVFPAPRGWESRGDYWAIFHTWQELEQDHDPVYSVVETEAGLKLGREIPEYECGATPISAEAQVILKPSSGEAEISAQVRYVGATPGRSILFRLNNNYQVDRDGWLRSGSLLAVTPTQAEGEISFKYATRLGKGAPHADDRDQVTEQVAYLTSYWIPSLGRLPMRTRVSISGPDHWVLRSEGELVESRPDPTRKGFKIDSFRCDVPISYPKVLGGAYVVAAEGVQNGKTLRSYHLPPIDKVRAEKDLEWMKKAITFYEANLAPFPFKEYSCFDGSNYYGIESYSYTILAPSITTWAVSHEIGHTYFGGLAPSGYVKDSWNEGVTQYVDEFVLHGSDGVAKNALAQIGVAVPASEMPVAWEFEGASYYRGGYAMQMLEREIGRPKVFEGLRALLKDRVGKETVWADLRPYFERASGRKLDWFWNQWILGAEFPRLDVVSASTAKKGVNGIQVRIKQSGTSVPFRLQFNLRATGPAGVREHPVTMATSEQTFIIPVPGQFTKVEINPVGGTLARVGKAVSVVR